MVRLVTDAAPQVVHADWWPERMTVTLKGAASYYERLCIKGAAMVAHQDSATGALTVDVSPHMAALRKLEIGVLEWTRSGAPERPTRADLEALDERDADYLLDEMNRVWAEWDAGRPPVAVTPDSEPAHDPTPAPVTAARTRKREG